MWKGVLGMMVECCRLYAMLARVLLIVFLSMCGLAYAEQERPHVFLIQLNTQEAEVDIFKSESWMKQSGSCLGSPGRSAVQTALLYGTPAMQQGVVADLDWRRKPVRGITLAHTLAKHSYQTRFYGAWCLGENAPYTPQSRGFHQASFHTSAERDTLTDSWRSSKEAELQLGGVDKPHFIHIAEGRALTRGSIFNALSKWMEKTKRPAIVMILESGKIADKQYHHPAKWHCFSRGLKKSAMSIQVDWDLHHAILRMIGVKVNAESDFRFFHYANWPVTESAEKNRHRGSLVIGNGLALVDGLSLYRATHLMPDLNQPLDLAENQQAHRKLLTEHAQWWQVAGKALHDTRAFEVGKRDGNAVLLTALDWRVTKIIDAEGKSPNSSAMVYQDDLLAILGGLKNNPEYKETFPAYSGSWSVNIMRPGRYKITASLLPKDTKNAAYKELMKLTGGTASIRLGRNVAQLKVIKGATAVTLQTDADAGVIDLECWFTGQLALTRELGAFFVEIERVGDKKFDLKAKAAE